MRGALGVGMLLFVAGPVLADCASPNTFLVPESGVLPSKAALHVFAPGWASSPPEIAVHDANGDSIAARVTAQPSSDAFQVFRVEVSAPEGTALVVRMNRRTYHYTVGKGAESAGKGAARITRTSSKSYAWMCSHHTTRDLAVSPIAPVYRVRWARSEDAVRDGKGEVVLLPHRAIELAFRWKEDETIPEDALLQLGHLNCAGETLSWKDGAIWASITAIYPDGSETPASDPVHLEPPAPTRDRSP